jgi:hypothetical protein
MNTLICTLGTREIDTKFLERYGLGKMPERERSQYLLDHWPSEPFDLPIVGCTVRCVQQISREPFRVVLVASDQKDTLQAQDATKDHWKNDTCNTAEVIRRALSMPMPGWQPISVELIDIWIISDIEGKGGNPADYDLVYPYLMRQLRRLRAVHGEQRTYLSVTSGTPATTTSLLMAGVELFGAHAQVLYLPEKHTTPTLLDTGRRLQFRPLQSAIRSNIATYNYNAAHDVLKSSKNLFQERLAPGAFEALDAMLAYCHCRFNFDLDGAVKALATVIQDPPASAWQQQLVAYHAAVADVDRAAKLAEVYHGAAARYQVGSYTDFLTQVVRFKENILRYCCLELQAQFIDNQGNPNDEGRFWYSSTMEKKELSIGTLKDCFQEVAKQQQQLIEPLLTHLQKLTKLVYLRNSLTHTMTGVDKRILAHAFDGPKATVQRADMIVPHLATIYYQATRRTLGVQPFDAINIFLTTLLHEADNA